MSPTNEAVTTHIFISRVAELLRHQEQDRAALIAQRMYIEKRAITAVDVGTLTQDERISLHAALLIVGKGLLELQNELPSVDVPHALKLIEDSIDACDTIALAPLIASMQPAPDRVQ